MSPSRIPDPWRCGGSHSYLLARCPDAGVNDNPPTRQQMSERLDRWLEKIGRRQRD